jgi:hypothetical protein
VSVQGLQTPHPQSATVDGRDLDLVQADRVRPVRRAGAEDPLGRSVGIPPRVHAQYVAAGAIESGDDEDLAASADAPQTLEHVLVEYEPRLWSAFVGLPGADARSVRGDSTLPMALTSKLFTVASRRVPVPRSHRPSLARHD